HLLAVVGGSAKDLAAQLRRFADGQVNPLALSTQIKRKKRPKVGFVFSGQGGQWNRMGRQLMDREPVFLHAMEDIDACFRELAGWSLLDELDKDAPESRIDDTLVVQ